jgi:hypothetical protein
MSKTTPEQMTQTMIDNMPEKTGKSMQQWLQIVAKSGLQKHGEIVKKLKADSGMGHGFANLVAHMHLAAKSPAQGSDDMVSAQYKGPKEGLRPIYDALVKMITAFGKDVEVSPKKTYVSFRRSKQFALVQPSTKDRVDVGINLKGVPAGPRLEASGSFNAMVSHRVRLSRKADVNNELKAWLKKAYDAA